MTRLFLFAFTVLLAGAIGLSGENGIKYTFDSSLDDFIETGGQVAALNGQVSIQGKYPGTTGIIRLLQTGAKGLGSASFDVFIPDDAPWDLQPGIFLKDKDGLWFQASGSSHVVRGKWQTVHVDLSPSSPNIKPVGHEAVWNQYYAKRMVAIGLKLYATSAWKGAVLLDNLALHIPEKEKTEPIRIQHLRCNTDSPGTYRPFELSFSIACESSNPFDPDDIKVDVQFRSQSGKTYNRPCFFFQPFRREQNTKQVEIATASGRACWKASFTPLESGNYTWKLTIRTRSGTTQTKAHSFDVAPGKPKGFVRISRKDPRYFETADDKWFYPIGQNIHAPFDKRGAKMLRVPVLPNRGTFAYEDYFAKMAANGENAVVVWMSNWWLSIEWLSKWKRFRGLSDYNLANAWKLDHLLACATKHNIYVHLVLDNHGKASLWVDSEWKDNPYNSANSGPCYSPESFFSSNVAFNIYKKRLRYIVARWAHHPNLLAFEIVSELNLVGSNRKFKNHPSHAEWVKRVAEYLSEIDCYKRPITIQYSNDWQTVDEKVASLPELDFIVGDAYKGGGSIVPMILKTAEKNTRFDKPTFSAEFGGNWNGTTPQRLHADLHAGMWANAMTNTAGAPFFWWFDYVDRYDLYSEYKALSLYMKDEDRRSYKGKTVILPVSKAGKESKQLGAVALIGANKSCFWIYDVLASEIMPETKYARSHSNVTVSMDGLGPGKYKVEYWDTRTGTIVQYDLLTAKEKSITLCPPIFKVDVAGKIKKLSDD